MQFTTILAFTALFVCAYTQNNNVTVRDLKLFVNSQEFFIKAVAYNPVPLGYQNMTSELMGGGGYCSPLQDMWTNWNSACYDSDYYSTTTGAPGASAPSNGWFTNLWIRDFPILKAMGTNTLRLYNTNPSTAAATTLYSNIFLTGYGKNHTAFMDYAQQFGFKIIFPLIGDATLIATIAADVYKRYIMWQINEIGNHPALLMYTLGNELDLNSNPDLLASVNLYIGFARSYQLLKWGREIPITSAVVDLPNSYNYLAANLEVDVFTTNAGYRGISFTDLWSGNSISEGWWNLSCRYNKPVFIGEIGWQAINNSIMQSIPNWFNQIWLDAINHIDQGCIGGTFFEYNDEPYSKAAVDQQTMGVVSFQVSVANGVSSLEQFAWNPDTAVLKQIYSYVANGTTPEGVSSNFNTDVFQLIGRSAYTLSTLPSTSICAANFTLKSCPTQSDYDCSGNGICDYWSGSCSCGVGWSGSDCSVGTCSGSATCSGNGQCYTDLSPPFCVCDDGSDGATCGSLQASNSCPIGAGWSTACANGNGICDNSTWTCTCHPGWTGYACSIPTNSIIIASTSTGQISGSSTGSTGSNPSSTGTSPSSSTGSNPSSTVNSASSTTGSDDETSSTGTFGTSSSTGNAHGNSAVSVAPTFAAVLLLLVSLLM